MSLGRSVGPSRFYTALVVGLLFGMLGATYGRVSGRVSGFLDATKKRFGIFFSRLIQDKMEGKSCQNGMSQAHEFVIMPNVLQEFSYRIYKLYKKQFV